MITINKNTTLPKIVKDFGFLLDAKSKDDSEPKFFNIFCIDNKLICTDTKRLHILDVWDINFEFKNRCYLEVVKNTKFEIILKQLSIKESKEIGKFPNYKQVIPENDKNTLSINLNFDESLSFNIKKLYSNMDNYINMDQLKEFSGEFKVYINEGLFPLMFKKDLQTALIMPIEYKE